MYASIYVYPLKRSCLFPYSTEQGFIRHDNGCFSFHAFLHERYFFQRQSKTEIVAPTTVDCPGRDGGDSSLQIAVFLTCISFQFYFRLHARFDLRNANIRQFSGGNDLFFPDACQGDISFCRFGIGHECRHCQQQCHDDANDADSATYQYRGNLSDDFPHLFTSEFYVFIFHTLTA